MTEEINVQTIDEFIDQFDINDYKNTNKLSIIEELITKRAEDNTLLGYAEEFLKRTTALDKGGIGQTYLIDYIFGKVIVKKTILCRYKPKYNFFTKLCSSAQEGDLVYRIPVTQNDKLLVLAPNYITENLISYIISRVISKYTNGFVHCHDFMYNSNNEEKPIYTILEPLDKKDIRTINDFNEGAYVLFQLFHALSSAQKLFKFTHYDLHAGNIMCKQYDKKVINCYELDNGQYLYTSFDYDMKIIDFGFARIESNKNIIKPSIWSDAFSHDAMDRYEFNPYYDIYSILIFAFIGSTNEQLNRLKNDMLRYFLITENIDNDSPYKSLNSMLLYPNENWRPDPKKLAQNKLSTPTEMIQYLVSYINRNNRYTQTSDIQSIKNYLEYTNFYVSNVFVKIPGMKYYKNLRKNKDYTPVPKIIYKYKDNDSFDFITIYYCDNAENGQIKDNNNNTLKDNKNKDIRIKIRTGILTYINNTLPKSLYDGKTFANQNMQIAYIDQVNGIKNGYKFRFDCCGSDQRNYFAVNTNVESGITINSSFFQIFSTFKPIGYFKSNDLIMNNYVDNIPIQFKDYYGIIAIDDNGLLKIDEMKNNDKYENILSCGALLYFDNVCKFNKDTFNNTYYSELDRNTKKYLFRSNNSNQEWTLSEDGVYIKNVNYIKPGELYHAGNPNPRSVIGITQDNKVVFIRVEGRDNRGVGMDFSQLADLCKSLNLKDAINVDGGQSSKMTWKKPGENIVNVAGGNESVLGAYPVGGIIAFVK